MKILVLSDIHSRVDVLKKIIKTVVSVEIVDLVIIAGDLTHFENIDKAISILRIIRGYTSKPVLFIPGNCDDPGLLSIDRLDENIINIHGRQVLFGNLYFYGIGGSNFTPFNTWIEWSEDDLKRFLIVPYSLPSNRLLMITHAPIYGVMDEIQGLNVGSKSLREFLERHGALIWITGHLHEYSNYTRHKDTWILNPGPAMHGYYGLIEVTDRNCSISIADVYSGK